MHQANLIDSALQCAVFDTNYSCTAIKKLSSGQRLVVRSCRFWAERQHRSIAPSGSSSRQEEVDDGKQYLPVLGIPR
jgi:hypothetical protein